jgi:hypothetical protein
MRSAFARLTVLIPLFSLATHLIARVVLGKPLAIYAVFTLGVAMALAVLWAAQAKSQRERRRIDDMRDSALW